MRTCFVQKVQSSLESFILFNNNKVLIRMIITMYYHLIIQLFVSYFKSHLNHLVVALLLMLLPNQSKLILVGLIAI